ncbi:MAG TPA: DoxX family protein [Burkholderiales bacterium]|jgi:putative oxidoreductase|nr:DoxX family protein [Burkholderiales bacterium]
MQTDAIGKLVLRLALGGLILFHGVGKILHPESVEPIVKGVTAMGLPGAFAYAVYLGEVLAPLMILLGLFARFGGLLVVINMLFAVMLVHTSQLLTLSKSGGYGLELQTFYLLCGLTVALLGSGRYAVKPD